MHTGWFLHFRIINKTIMYKNRPNSHYWALQRTLMHIKCINMHLICNKCNICINIHLISIQYAYWIHLMYIKCTLNALNEVHTTKQINVLIKLISYTLQRSFCLCNCLRVIHKLGWQVFGFFYHLPKVHLESIWNQSEQYSIYLI